MDENTTTIPPSTAAIPAVLSQEELEAKAAQEKAAQAVAAAEAYAQAVRDANLGVTQSLIVYNNAKTHAAWGIGIGAVTAGVGILLGAFRR